MTIELYPHQQAELEATKDRDHVAYYHDMGLGKTYVGAEKMVQLGAKVNLLICQKSKIADWVEHFEKHYDLNIDRKITPFNLTNKKDYNTFVAVLTVAHALRWPVVGIVNYETAWRRPELAEMCNCYAKELGGIIPHGFTLMLDESSVIQNEKSNRSKFILNKLKPNNVILLSGTPTGGKYEKLWSQMKLLGWKISKDLYWKHYVDVQYLEGQGFPVPVVRGYKNVDRLKAKMRKYGCRFLKTSEVFDLPEQVFTDVKVETTQAYRIFKKDRIVVINGADGEGLRLVGDTSLTKRLYERQLCGAYNHAKLKALEDIIDSTDDRLVIFYNYNNELDAIDRLCFEKERPVSIVNGKTKDLTNFRSYNNAILLVQYQAGAMGGNYQEANKMVFFTPTDNAENWMQAKKRIHRIGQKSTCFYYKLICKNSVEEKIYRSIEKGQDYTLDLFEKEENA